MILDTPEFKSKQWLLYFKRSYVERSNGVFSVSLCISLPVSPNVMYRFMDSSL